VTTKLDIASRLLVAILTTDYRNRKEVHQNMRANVDLAVEYALLLMKKIPEKPMYEEIDHKKPVYFQGIPDNIFCN
jgi:hypothetical protein